MDMEVPYADLMLLVNASHYQAERGMLLPRLSLAPMVDDGVHDHKRKQSHLDHMEEAPLSKMRKIDSSDSIQSSLRGSSYGESGGDMSEEEEEVTWARRSRERGGSKRSKEEAKVLHRAIERKRTQRITEAMYMLKDELKVHRRLIDKDSKSEILQASIQFVLDLQAVLRKAMLCGGYTPVSLPLHSMEPIALPELEKDDLHYGLARHGVSKEDQRRALHRAVERRRTNRINELINHMKLVLAAEDQVTSDKSNKAAILSSFLCYLQALAAEVKAAPGSDDFFALESKFSELTGKFEPLTFDGEGVSASRSKFSKRLD